LVYARRVQVLRDGLLLGLVVTLVFSARFLIEFVKTPHASYEAGCALRVGQLLSIPFILAGIALIVRSRVGAARP
jgi:phosphatidylglycerol:prolipoprotein diacylglycerol transferase